MHRVEDAGADRRQTVAWLLGACGWLAGSPALASGCELPPRLRLAFIPKSRQAVEEAAYGLLAQALAEALAMPVDLVPVASYSAVVQGLQAGHIDVAELGPATYVQMLQGGAVARPFAAMVSEGEVLTRYHSLLVVRSASRKRRWADLQGATLNLVDPASTSGALLPRQAVMAHTGQALEVFFSRVSYAGSHTRALEAVRSGRVDAAFVSSQSLATALRHKSLAPGELRTLWVSSPLPTDPLVLRKKLCPALQARLGAVFLRQQPLLRPALRALGMQGVVAVNESDYAGVAALLSGP